MAFGRELLVLSRGSLTTPGRNGRDTGLEALLLGAVGAGGQLDECVQGHLHPGGLFLRDVHEVGVDATEDSLVGDDDDVLAALQLHDDGFETDDDVAVGLAAAVAVVVLVLVAGLEVLGVLLGDLLVGQAIADAGVQLVECLPLQLLESGFGFQVAGGLDGAAESRGPDDDLGVLGDAGLAHQLGESTCVGLTTLRDVGVTANAASQVVFGLTVLLDC